MQTEGSTAKPYSVKEGAGGDEDGDEDGEDTAPLTRDSTHRIVSASPSEVSS
jgi:hypothetical protein